MLDDALQMPNRHLLTAFCFSAALPVVAVDEDCLSSREFSARIDLRGIHQSIGKGKPKAFRTGCQDPHTQLQAYRKTLNT